MKSKVKKTRTEKPPPKRTPNTSTGTRHKRTQKTQPQAQGVNHDKTPASVCFIKRTPHGELANRIKKVEQELGGTFSTRR